MDTYQTKENLHTLLHILARLRKKQKEIERLVQEWRAEIDVVGDFIVAFMQEIEKGDE